MAIVIPVNAYIVTLNGVDPLWTDDAVRSAFQGANRIWSGSGINFSVRSVNTFSDKVMDGSDGDAMNDQTFFYLITKYPGRDYPVAYFIRRFAGIEGGTSTTKDDTNWALASHYDKNQAEASRILAHELGHLIGLGHVNETFKPGPGKPIPAWMRNNLMYSAISLDTKLSADQIKAAKSSALARKFGG